MNGQEKILLPASDQSKIYSGDCYIFQYSYPGEDKEEHLIGTWFGKQSVEVIICQECYLLASSSYYCDIFLTISAFSIMDIGSTKQFK